METGPEFRSWNQIELNLCPVIYCVPLGASTWFSSPFSFCLTPWSGEGNAPHSSTLAWKIPWTEEHGGLQSMGSLRVRHNWTSSLHFILDSSETAMATHSSTLAWKIPWMEEPGRLQSMGSQRVGHDWETSLSLFTFMHWRRKWQPTLVFLPGESQGQGSLVGCRLWGCTELDTTDVT